MSRPWRSYLAFPGRERVKMLWAGVMLCALALLIACGPRKMQGAMRCMPGPSNQMLCAISLWEVEDEDSL